MNYVQAWNQYVNGHPVVVMTKQNSKDYYKKVVKMLDFFFFFICQSLSS